LNQIAAILFDCDGVLVDSEPLANRMLSDFFATRGVHMSVDQCRAAFTGLNPRGVGEKLLALHAVDLIQPLVLHASNLFMQALRRDGLTPLPGLLDALSAIRTAGIPIASASNSPLPELIFKLGLAGLLPAFAPHHYSGDELGLPKPDPGVYLHAAARLGVPPARCVVIEDSRIGVQAGVRAGMRVLGYTGTHDHAAHAAALTAAGAETTFNHMGRLAELLGLPEAGG